VTAIRCSPNGISSCSTAPRALGEDHRAGERRLGQHDGELVAAVAGGAVLAPAVLVQQRGDALQHGVAGEVAVAIVHRLEVVDVEQQHRERVAVAAAACELALERVLERPAIAHLREPVERHRLEDALVILRLRARALEQLEDDAAHRDEVADLERDVLLWHHRLSVAPRAVRRAEVAQPDAVPVAADRTVDARHAAEREHHAAAALAADREPALGQVDAPAEVRTGQHHEPGGGGPRRPRLAQRRSRLVRCGLHPRPIGRPGPDLCPRTGDPAAFVFRTSEFDFRTKARHAAAS
jgi:hypothetical protein